MKHKTIIFYDFEATNVSRDADMISVGLVAVTSINVQSYDDLTQSEFIEHFEGVKNHSSKIKKYRKQEIKTFYSEFTDFNIDKCDDWVKENVMSKLKYKQNEQKASWFMEDSRYNHYFGYGKQKEVSIQLKQWLSQFEEIQFWSDDIYSNQKLMLIDLISEWETKKQEVVFTIGDYQTNKTFLNKIGLPKHLPNIKYDQFFDLHSILKWKGIETDINRETFVNKELVQESVFGKHFNNLPFDNLIGEKHNALWDAYVTWKCYEKLMI